MTRISPMATIATAVIFLLHLSSFSVAAFSPCFLGSGCAKDDVTRVSGEGAVEKDLGSRQTSWRLHVGGDGYNYNAGDSSIPSSGGNGDWKLYNSFEQFLSQRAIQALLFHMNSLKDRNTAHWLEDFTQPIIRKRTMETSGRDQVLSNMASAWNDATHDSYNTEQRPIQLLTYHGLHSINTTVFPTWVSYFEQLLQQPTLAYEIESSRLHVPTYTLDIVPASLCSRIISVREQIAREFVNDLDVIAESSLTAMEKYREKHQTPSNNDDHNKLERIHQYFLDISVHEDYQPSPLRKGNFDLLLSLTTQEAIHRILNQADNNGNDAQFLRNFYAQRIPTHWTGSNYYGRADDFLDELLQTLPSMMQLQDSDCGLVDPENLVEMIFQEREKVASEWIELSLDVPQSHTIIKRLQLNKLMGIEDKPAQTNENSSFQ